MIPVGNPAIGNDFIDRENEISLILSFLEKDSVLLIAPRRFGKTSIMLSAIKEEKILRNKEINAELIENIYNFRILGNEGKHYFEHYYQRLRIYYDDLEEKAARAILKKVCEVDYYPIDLAYGIYKQQTAIDNYEQFMDLLGNLSNDFYIEHNHETGLNFYSKILKDWWRIYHGGVE